MKKLLFITISGITLFISTTSAHAMNIQIMPNGNLEFINGDVLGESSNKENLQKQKQLKNRVEKSSTPHNSLKERRIIKSGKNKELRIKPNDKNLQIELREKNNQETITPKPNLQNIEKINDDNVRLSFPARVKTELKDERSDIKDQLKIKVKEKIEEHTDEPNNEQLENRTQYQVELQQQRQERHDEMVEIKNKIEDQHQVLELKSRNVKAALKKGAEFSLNPTTNEVTIVTPVGTSHTLNHLPDQAVEKMQAAGVFTNQQTTDQEIEVETAASGEIIYKKRDIIRKKLFGLFPRKIESEIILNDQTGAVTEETIPSTNIFKQFFNSVSF